MNCIEIERWLQQYSIYDYTINENLDVDVNGDVILTNKNLTEFPFQFGVVTGDFSCSFNILTSLQHCPTTVGGNFYCTGNILTSLEHCPSCVGRGFYCYKNKLTSLQYCPSHIGGDFGCENNPFIANEENEEEWLQAIMTCAGAYHYIKEPTERLTNLYKALYAL